MRRVAAVLPLIVALAAACGETTTAPNVMMAPAGASLDAGGTGKLDTPTGPTLECPANGQDEGWCTATWGGVEGAASYELVIQGAGGTQKVETPATSAAFELPWSQNDWCVKVRALAEGGPGTNSSQYTACVAVDGTEPTICAATVAPALTVASPAAFPYDIQRSDNNLNQNSIFDVVFSGTVDWKGDDSGVTTSLTYAVDDEYLSTDHPSYTAADMVDTDVESLTGTAWSQTIPLPAYKLGGDADGHSYLVTLTATNCFGSAQTTATVVFDHDSGNDKKEK